MIPVFRNNPAPMRRLPLAGVDAEFMRFLDLRRPHAAGDEGMSDPKFEVNDETGRDRAGGCIAD